MPSLRIRGADQLQRDLQRLGALKLERLRKDVAEHVTTNTKLRFRDQKDPDGRPWDPLKPSTRARRKQRSPKILLLTARLRNSITWNIEGTVIHVGTNVKYARVHNEGSARGARIPIPKRKFLGICQDDREYIRTRFEDLLSGII